MADKKAKIIRLETGVVVSCVFAKCDFFNIGQKSKDEI